MAVFKGLGPTPVLGERYSLDRPSSGYKRASRRLRKKGYTSQAAQFAANAELLKMNEPTTMRPEHRALEKQAEQALIARRSNAGGYGSGFDPSADMADLRGNFFSNLGAASMPSSEKMMFTNRFSPQFSALDKEQGAFIQLQEAQRKSRMAQQQAQMTPVIASHIQEIMDLPGAPSTKQKAIRSLMLRNPYSLGDSNVQSMFTVASKELGADSSSLAKQQQTMQDLLEKAASGGNIAAVSQFGRYAPATRGILSEIAETAHSKELRGLQLDELDDIDSKLGALNKLLTGGGIEDEILAQKIREGGVNEKNPAGRHTKEYLKHLLKLTLGISGDKPLPPKVTEQISGLDAEGLLVFVSGVAAQQRASLSTRVDRKNTAALSALSKATS
jgi:hypothetical protein